jgi:hypothetical protein
MISSVNLPDSIACKWLNTCCSIRILLMLSYKLRLFDRPELHYLFLKKRDLSLTYLNFQLKRRVLRSKPRRLFIIKGSLETLLQ